MAVFTTAALVTGLTTLGFTAATAATIVSVAATVATAAMYVGMAGLALKVVGAVTGNKTLSKIGTYMGYAGLAGAAVTGMIGTSEFVDQGLFEMGTKEMVADQATAYAATGAPTQQMLGNQIVTETQSQLASAAASNAAPHIVGQTGTIGQSIGANVIAGFDPTTAANQAGYEEFTAPENIDPSQAPAGAQAAQAEAGSQAATVTGQPAPSSANNFGAEPLKELTYDVRGHVPSRSLLDSSQSGSEDGWAEWWKKVDPSVKAMGGLAAGQTAAGAAQGWFAGQSAEEKLALETQINSQRQTELERRIKNASYAPRVFTGPTGLLQQGGK